MTMTTEQTEITERVDVLGCAGDRFDEILTPSTFALSL